MGGIRERGRVGVSVLVAMRGLMGNAENVVITNTTMNNKTDTNAKPDTKKCQTNA